MPAKPKPKPREHKPTPKQQKHKRIMPKQAFILTKEVMQRILEAQERKKFYEFLKKVNFFIGLKNLELKRFVNSEAMLYVLQVAHYIGLTAKETAEIFKYLYKNKPLINEIFTYMQMEDTLSIAEMLKNIRKLIKARGK